uniref:Uncharacterized protein n=1 Tax=Alexandrium catenella TaxID=2925 RepID=A0A7S1S7K2_ALECA
MEPAAALDHPLVAVEHGLWPSCLLHVGVPILLCCALCLRLLGRAPMTVPLPIATSGGALSLAPPSLGIGATEGCGADRFFEGAFQKKAFAREPLVFDIILGGEDDCMFDDISDVDEEVEELQGGFADMISWELADVGVVDAPVKSCCTQRQAWRSEF